MKHQRAAIAQAPVSAAILKQLTSYAGTCTQLLRHFWACFRQADLASKGAPFCIGFPRVC